MMTGDTEQHMDAKQYDVLILGGGICGTALLYSLARYTDLKRIAVVEKCSDVAMINSHGRNNSQTLHCGDIETNYTLEKALKVKSSAEMLVNYVTRNVKNNDMLFKYPKMILGVGDKECRAIEARYKEFSPHFTSMQLWNKDRIAEIEPNVVKDRKEEIMAIGIEDEYCAVNYQALANSFIEQAKTVEDKNIDVFLDTKIKSISKTEEGYCLKTKDAELNARFVVVSAGGHSLLFAQRMGYGNEYACLPMAGSFYFAPNALNGKVYTMQNDKLPFAAIHGDPDVLVPGKTRFGPTALVLPMLERYNYKTIPEFFRVFSFGLGVMKVMWDLFKVKDIRNYMFKNVLFEIPLLRRYLFVRDAKKIVPGIKVKDLSFAKRFGGIRPVMIDKKNRKLHLGEAKISPGNGIIFNMTPSPGATSCLQNAELDLRAIVDYLGCEFDEKKLNDELHAKTE